VSHQNAEGGGGGGGGELVVGVGGGWVGGVEGGRSTMLGIPSHSLSTNAHAHVHKYTHERTHVSTHTRTYTQHAHNTHTHNTHVHTQTKKRICTQATSCIQNPHAQILPRTCTNSDMQISEGHVHRYTQYKYTKTNKRGRNLRTQSTCYIFLHAIHVKYIIYRDI